MKLSLYLGEPLALGWRLVGLSFPKVSAFSLLAFHPVPTAMEVHEAPHQSHKC